MRIAINAVAVRGGGGETYLLNILKALCVVGTWHEFCVILAPRHRPLLKSLPRQADALVCASVPERPWLRIGWEQTVLPVVVRRWRIDVLFAVNHNGPSV